MQYELFEHLIPTQTAEQKKHLGLLIHSQIHRIHRNASTEGKKGNVGVSFLLLAQRLRKHNGHTLPSTSGDLNPKKAAEFLSSKIKLGKCKAEHLVRLYHFFHFGMENDIYATPIDAELFPDQETREIFERSIHPYKKKKIDQVEIESNTTKYDKDFKELTSKDVLISQKIESEFCDLFDISVEQQGVRNICRISVDMGFSPVNFHPQGDEVLYICGFTDLEQRVTVKLGRIDKFYDCNDGHMGAIALRRLETIKQDGENFPSRVWALFAKDNLYGLIDGRPFSDLIPLIDIESTSSRKASFDLTVESHISKFRAVFPENFNLESRDIKERALSLFLSDKVKNDMGYVKLFYAAFVVGGTKDEN